jgi:peptidoglycan hydrolase CwlO-like protein
MTLHVNRQVKEHATIRGELKERLEALQAQSARLENELAVTERKIAELKELLGE